jgi:hypothetical protein
VKFSKIGPAGSTVKTLNRAVSKEAQVQLAVTIMVG